ncbi:histone deacetylase HDT1-like isoform X1 [Gossypium arboreum]|uniref:histone deacetylase HDT1-like isoform X1 n=1 Tax=Gossypium arboreum TaxID=29729 RepID=UPI00081949E3|nr:histone deacetylase HDT1-like isoform X1 [Gossypium arboreum]
MEFWGVEVKSGQNFEVELEDDGSRILHLSQVALGEGTGDNKKEKGKETICLYLKFKNQKFVVGTLSQEKCPQIALDLVLHDKFELFHTWKNGSVYVTGYYVDTSQGSDTESEGELPEPTMNLVKSEPAASDPTTTKQVKIVEPKKDDDSSDEDEEDSSAEDEESSEEQEPRMLVNGENDTDDADSDEDDSDEESLDEDQKTPEKAGPSKKRPAESSKKTPAPEKKAKLVTPQKTDGKKAGGHTATPHPSKKAGKTSAAAAQVKQTPKSGGSFPCKSCGRSFGSENALQSHSKAKHGTQA